MKATSRSAKAKEEGDASKRASLLSRLGCKSEEEILLTVPKDFVDFRHPVRDVSEELIGSVAYFQLTLVQTELQNKSKQICGWAGQPHRLTMTCADAKGTRVKVVVFGNVWAWKDARAGDEVHVQGELKEFNRVLFVTGCQAVEARCRGRIAPIYPGKKGSVKSEDVGSAVADAMHQIERAGYALVAKAGLREADFKRETGFDSGMGLLRAMHEPRSTQEAAKAVDVARRMAADAVVRASVAARQRAAIQASALLITNGDVEELKKRLPFTLTQDQGKAIDEIIDDLRSPFPMRRLLSGDVGTGKSAVFMVAAAAALKAGATVGILAPSLLVVEQICRELGEFYPEVKVHEVRQGGQTGEGINVGTTALLNAAARDGRAFDLVITDEQQKFGVHQKTGVVDAHTNVLEATATAIPRTQALIQFGGMDLSVLRQVPVEKVIQTYITSAKSEDDERRLVRHFSEVVARGFQVAAIYPQVGQQDGDKPGRDDPGYKTVQAAADRWEAVFPGMVAILHGRMSTEEKTEALRKMLTKEKRILISSIVVEVGVTIPSLTAMLIVNPERYGLNQIHQLRGRLARKGGHGKLFLRVDESMEELTRDKPDVLDRLTAVKECNDGFELAERDMELRGFGDVQDQSKSQSGSARSLFWGVKLRAADLKDAARRLKLS